MIVVKTIGCNSCTRMSVVLASELPVNHPRVGNFDIFFK